MGEEQLTMDQARLGEFFASVPMAAVASLRKSGAPLVVPLGYMYRDGAFYLGIREGRAGTQRLRRDERVSITVFDHEFPPSWVVAEGRAREIPDPGHAIKRALLTPMMQRVGIDVEQYLAFWTSGKGRVVFRVEVDRMISMDGRRMQAMNFDQLRRNYDATFGQNTG
ncbi:MAG: pyridoxamine 5'-phosphate oxidase family protein [Gammaproteobacteria bacterium]